MLRIMTLTALAASAALLAGAGAASASPPAHQVTSAVTFVADRPDSGNGTPDPYWADDTLTRTITITRTGGTPGAYTFTAVLKDTGTFTTIKGAKAPDQGGSYAGDVIKSKVTGTVTGDADFTFTASSLPGSGFNAGVPLTENDHGQVPSDSTSKWFELAFPSGTTFEGADTAIGPWGWTYNATVVTVTSQQVCLAPGFCWPVPVVHVSHQRWIDSSSNTDGDVPADGNITG